MAPWSPPHIPANQGAAVMAMAPSMGVPVQVSGGRRREHSSWYSPPASSTSQKTSVYPTSTMPSQTSTRPSPFAYLPPPTSSAPSKVPSYTPPVLSPRSQQAMIARLASVPTFCRASSANVPVHNIQGNVTAPSLALHPSGPVRQLSYTPPPASMEAPRGTPSYTPLPSATRQGVPSYTPAPIRTQGPKFECVEDRTIAFMPLFAIKDADSFVEVCNRCIQKVKNETLCLSYGFSMSKGPDGDIAFSRESYVNAEGLVEHLHNIEILFLEGLCRYGQLVSLQIHGPKDELDKLRQHPIIQELCPQFFELLPGSFEVIELPAQLISEADVNALAHNSRGNAQAAHPKQGSWHENNRSECYGTTPAAYLAPAVD